VKGIEVIRQPQQQLFYCYQKFSPLRRWEDNIKMDPQEVGCGGLDWIDLA
jgi:hypothetical protein